AVDERVGDEGRGDSAVSAVMQRYVVVDHQLLTAGTRAEDHADLGAILVGELEAGVRERLLPGSDAEMQTRLAAASGLGIHPFLRVEVLDLTGDLRLVGRRVEIGD